jgi:hypothetical protein
VSVEWTAFYDGAAVGTRGDLEHAKNEQRDWQREVADPKNVALAFRRISEWSVGEPSQLSDGIVPARQVTEPTLDKHGYEVHPSWGMIGASRGSWSPPGVALFDSDIRHQHAVTVTVKGAARRRDYSHDHIYGGSGEVYVEVTMSEAQWASFVSSMNVGDGTPCTVQRTQNQLFVPQAPYAPRLALTMSEAKNAAHEAFAPIGEALAAYQKLVADKAPARERKQAYELLESRIRNAAPNVDFVGKKLAEHAENVVNRARADIEAYVTKKAVQLGLDPAEVGGIALMPGDSPREVES